jgi:hypothetical protein
MTNPYDPAQGYKRSVGFLAATGILSPDNPTVETLRQEAGKAFKLKQEQKTETPDRSIVRAERLDTAYPGLFMQWDDYADMPRVFAETLEAADVLNETVIPYLEQDGMALFRDNSSNMDVLVGPGEKYAKHNWADIYSILVVKVMAALETVTPPDAADRPAPPAIG